MARAYPAKLLLFGEYTIIVGGQALATPLPLFQGRWAKAQAHESPVDLQQKLPAFLDYLRQREWARSFRLDAFARDLEQAYYFASTIPLGYGAGSSGALCAAVTTATGPPRPPGTCVFSATIWRGWKAFSTAPAPVPTPWSATWVEA